EVPLGALVDTVKVWTPGEAATGARFNVVSLPGASANGNTIGAAFTPSTLTFIVTVVKSTVPVLRTLAVNGVLFIINALRSVVPRGVTFTINASVTSTGGIAPSDVNKPGLYKSIQPSTLFLEPSESIN